MWYPDSETIQKAFGFEGLRTASACIEVKGARGTVIKVRGREHNWKAGEGMQGRIDFREELQQNKILTEKGNWKTHLLND